MSLFDRFLNRSAISKTVDIAEEKIIASLLVMAWVVEARDPYTGGHLWRVSRFSRLLADRSGLPEEEAARISIGGFLHDLGKVGIPDAILSKKDKLTDEEYEIIKTHPEVGKRMLAGHPFSSLAMDAVFMHHETPDGLGYPRGLKKGEIPTVARIVGICDAFDAMTSTRPYRRGMPVEKALSIIADNLGRQFDGEFGERFIRLGENAELNHIVGHSDEGIPLRDCLMCGPTVVVQRNATAGDAVYCRCCGGEYRLETDGAGLQPVPTGAKGSAADLEPVPDDALIGRLVGESAHIIQTGKLLSVSHQF